MTGDRLNPTDTIKLPPPPETQWAMLAGTRFLLASIVFFGHLLSTLGETWQGLPLLFIWNFGELAAVIGFFMISGFSIANSISSKPRGYIKRRIWRIWPTHVFSFLVFTLPFCLLIPKFRQATGFSVLPPNSHWQIVGSFFLVNGITAPTVEINAALWTLAIEECFYFMAPLFLKRSSRLLILMMTASGLLYIFSARLGITRFPEAKFGVPHAVFLWAWLAGFIYYRHRQSPLAKMAMLTLPVLLISVTNQLGGQYAGFTLAFTSAILVFGGEVPLKPDWLKDVLVYLGNVSYPLYIIHYPLFMGLYYYTESMNPFLYIALGFGVSVFAYTYVDAPNRARGRERIPRTSALQTAVVTSS